MVLRGYQQGAGLMKAARPKIISLSFIFATLASMPLRRPIKKLFNLAQNSNIAFDLIQNGSSNFWKEGTESHKAKKRPAHAEEEEVCRRSRKA